MAAKISAARALAQRLAEEKAAVAVAARASADGSLDEEELVQCGSPSAARRLISPSAVLCGKSEWSSRSCLHACTVSFAKRSDS